MDDPAAPPPLHFEVDPAFADLLADAGLDRFDALMQTPGDESLHKPSLANWRQRVVIRLGDQTFYLKRFTPPATGWLKRPPRDSSADVERAWIKRFTELGIPCPRCVAFGWRKGDARSAPASLLMTAAVPGESLEKLAARDPLDAPLRDRAFRLRLIDALAELVRQLHARGLFHRDLYLAHLFLAIGEDGEPRLTLIDLQRVIAPRLFKRRWQVKDLAALHYSTPPRLASRADRLRWFKHYRGATRLSRADKRLIRAVLRKTQRIARHSRKHQLG